MDEKVVNNACVACPTGKTNAADDDASGGNTTCDATLCAANQYVSNNACVACADGATNAADDDASGGNTTCYAIVSCATGYYLSLNDDRCLPRGSLPANVSDADIVQLASLSANEKVTNTAGRFATPTKKIIASNIKFTDARREFKGAHKIENVLGSRAVSNVLTSGLQEGEAMLVDAEFLGTPVKDEISVFNVKKWRSETLLIRPSLKKNGGVKKEDTALTCAADADVDLWPVRLLLLCARVLLKKSSLQMIDVDEATNGYQ